MTIDGISSPRRRRYGLATGSVRQQLVPQVAAAVDDYGPGQFMPPEQVANQEELPPIDEGSGAALPPPKKRSFGAWLKARTKKQWLIFSIVVVLLVGGGGVAAFALLHKPAPPSKPVVKAKKVVPPPAPISEASKLTGLQVDFEANKRPVIAVMIENSEFARPQSGIDQAGVVFEAIAEGGITRFLNLFQDKLPDYIGPVRSVRPYYLEWLLGFDASVAHVGGSAQALNLINQWNVKNLDQGNNGAYFHRIPSRDAPHNVYTSMAELLALAAKKGYGTSNYTGFERKNEAPSKTPTARSLDFNISGPTFNPHFDYDPVTNSYARSQAGAPHMVVNGAGVQTQLKPKVVIALTMVQGKADIYTTYGSIGTGHAYIFQDGIVTEATWHKGDKMVNFRFTDPTGKTIPLNPGQTWISIVGSNDRITYRP